ncbi:MAG: hypothetical protein FWH22_01730 [Fibromonadales bacterium]|nr:hypothetical protein [Fibromonadales bacterium]
MPINRDQFDKLGKIEIASWAVWSPGYQWNPDHGDCVEACNDKRVKFMWEQQGVLKNDVVFLAFNPSGRDSGSREFRTFGNFHSIRQGTSMAGCADMVLKEIIPPFENLHGAYMTDLSEQIENNPERVRIIVKEAKTLFEEQLKILGSKRYYVICFGISKDFTFEVIKKIYKPAKQPKEIGLKVKKYEYNCQDYEFIFYGVYHYTYNCSIHAEVKKAQLEIVNKDIGIEKANIAQRR